MGLAAMQGRGFYYPMDLAFDSSEKFNEGDHVRVNVANVGEMETSDGQKIYTVSGSAIQEEAEGEHEGRPPTQEPDQRHLRPPHAPRHRTQRTMMEASLHPSTPAPAPT